ncbi:MAG: histidinol-phosphate transaminase [Nitrososphaerota archaeon]
MRIEHGGNVWWTARESGRNVRAIVDFSSNVNPLGPPTRAIKAIEENLWRLPLYPDPEYTSLREKIAKVHGLKKENVVVGHGAAELIHTFCRSFVKKGDKVLIPAPTFGEYEVAAKRAEARIRYVNTGLKPEIESLMDEASQGAKFVFLCNPNNPTSTLITKKDVLRLLDMALSHRFFVFLDETYLEFSQETCEESLDRFVQAYPNLFIVRSLTKIFGLAGLRIGYGLGHVDTIETLMSLSTPWCVNCLAEVATLAALDDHLFIKRTRRFIDKEKLFLYEEFGRIEKLKAYSPKVNFLLINVKGTGMGGLEIKERLLKKSLLIRECTSFKGLGDGFIRVSIRKREENERLLKSLKEVIS